VIGCRRGGGVSAALWVSATLTALSAAGHTQRINKILHMKRRSAPCVQGV
jgi:hypothetical protein